MPIVNMRSMIEYASQHNFMIGAFEIWSLEMLEATLQTASYCNAPVILNINESDFNDFQFRAIMAAIHASTENISIPVSIHLNDGISYASSVSAINSGCNSIMIDTSYKSLKDNIDVTFAIVEMAHKCGVAVEGCLVHNSILSEEELNNFVNQTNVDLLFIWDESTIDTDPIQKNNNFWSNLSWVSENTSLPLSILANKQFQPRDFSAAANCNVVKIDFDIKYFEDFADGAISHKNIESLSHTIQACIFSTKSEGQANEIKDHVEKWSPIEHLIIYNTEGQPEKNSLEMIATGKELLSEIPGVQRVDVGRSVAPDARFRYVWLVRFCHPNVIDSYREHPTHVAFANELFRPVAGDRISIDYEIM